MSSPIKPFPFQNLTCPNGRCKSWDNSLAHMPPKKKHFHLTSHHYPPYTSTWEENHVMQNDEGAPVRKQCFHYLIGLSKKHLQLLNPCRSNFLISQGTRNHSLFACLHCLHSLLHWPLQCENIRTNVIFESIKSHHLAIPTKQTC